MYGNLAQAQQRGVGAYRSVLKETLTGRDLDASVLTRGALLLRQCQDNWESKDRPAELGKALKFNQVLWGIFQNDLARDDNPLPLKLRQDILRLSVFIDKKIFEIMAHPSPEKLTIIININTRLAAGLRGNPGM